MTELEERAEGRKERKSVALVIVGQRENEETIQAKVDAKKAEGYEKVIRVEFVKPSEVDVSDCINR